MKIASKQSGLRVASQRPYYSYLFKDADVPIEVDDKHAEKILQNPTFYKSDGKIIAVLDEWFEELKAIKGITKKAALEIVTVYPGKENLQDELAKESPKLPFEEKVKKILNDNYLNKDN